MNTMTQVSLDRDLAEDLINSKLRLIDKEIVKILDKWKHKSIEIFLKEAKSGTIKYAEDDAIVLQNLIDDQKELNNIKSHW